MSNEKPKSVWELKGGPHQHALLFEVTGTVTGVGFRAHVQRTALTHGLVGWVRNDSGGVVGFVQGDPMAIRRFMQALRPGPAGARIDTIETMEDRARPELQGFEIKR